MQCPEIDIILLACHLLTSAAKSTIYQGILCNCLSISSVCLHRQRTFHSSCGEHSGGTGRPLHQPRFVHMEHAVCRAHGLLPGFIFHAGLESNKLLGARWRWQPHVKFDSSHKLWRIPPPWWPIWLSDEGWVSHYSPWHLRHTRSSVHPLPSPMWSNGSETSYWWEWPGYQRLEPVTINKNILLCYQGKYLHSCLEPILSNPKHCL